LTKADIIQEVAEKGLSKRLSAEAVEAVFKIIKEELRKGEKVQLVGFGNFQVREKRARKGRNPQTGEEITISARRILKFKPGRALMETLNRRP
jgi:integration host factor subunit alpha